MELQSSLADESPIVTLKTGSKVSRFLVQEVMTKLKQMQQDMQNGAILLNDLVMKCRDENHEFFNGCQWKLSELGFLDTEGNVHGTMREIVLAAVDISSDGGGDSLGLISPIQN